MEVIHTICSGSLWHQGKKTIGQPRREYGVPFLGGGNCATMVEEVC